MSWGARMPQEAGQGPFVPDTGNAAAVLARCGAGERLWESPAERVHRLAVHVHPCPPPRPRPRFRRYEV